jgi:transposase-like protein
VAADLRALPLPRLIELMEETEENVLSYAAFLAEHWQKNWSNNPLSSMLGRTN